MNLTNEYLLVELTKYETELRGILSRFKENREGIWIERSDEPGLRQYVRELVDLFQDAWGGPNNYSQQISDEFDNGIRNFAGTPSFSSVQNIISLLKAASTRLKRGAELRISNPGEGLAKAARIGTNVCIGHGRSKEWKDLKDFINDRMRLPWDEFNRVSVAGIPNTVRLTTMLDGAAIAFLVLTGEDELGDGKMRARMNVVHEAGLFQGA